MRQPFICLECAKVTNGRCAEHTLLTVGMMATPDVYPLVRAEQWLTDPRWHDGVIAQIIRDLAQEVRDLLASLQQEDLHRLLTWFEPGVSSRIPPASEVIAHLEAQTAALRALAAEMREKAKAMQRESEQPRTPVERQFYCDGKAMALMYAADRVDALSR